MTITMNTLNQKLFSIAMDINNKPIINAVSHYIYHILNRKIKKQRKYFDRYSFLYNFATTNLHK